MKQQLDLKAEVTPQNLGEAIQQAIEIEIATIPVYLYTYYSLNREPDQSAISNALSQALVKKGLPQQEADTIALDKSAEIMVYANKVGALIMSVAIEEMLHLSLSSNLKQALAGQPQLVNKSPDIWPAYLPGHIPPFPINRAAFSLDQLKTFLKIESPKPLQEEQTNVRTLPYATIGLFYDKIKQCIAHCDLQYNTEAAQLVPGRGYYAQNNIDTVYYDKQHKPKFVNADDGADLIHVVDRASAIRAIDAIVEQGEGNQGSTSLNPDGSVDCCAITPADYDDPDHEELSHFEKFAQIYCQYVDLSNKFNELGIGDIDISQYFVLRLPTNPKTADYPASVQGVSTLLNAVYSYLYVMVEGCYRQKDNTQYELFMFGVHKTMIFILNSLCGDITMLKYTGPDGREYTVAPTFENYEFRVDSSPKSQLIELYNQAIGSTNVISTRIGQRIHDLPDVPLEPYLSTSAGKLIFA
ncbi:ferritin-like domain-containing protein [Spirosoma validum]|uniref:Ferritin-like protein n=1 Tax=Spirosoma validum TaxID=2771355 RepID=A0A927GFP7_9BACT|nr:ferritin-like protein [Spirosoma validum]MBD2756157.1 ferritin-like protein [Spirosoma validum]